MPKLTPMHKWQSCLVLVFLFQVLTLAAQPVIQSFNPQSGMAGTTVTITGNNFSSTPAGNKVFFGAVRATVVRASASSLTVTVPSGATFHPIAVTANARTAYSDRPFMLTAAAPYPGFSTTSFLPKTDFATDLYPNFITNIDLDGNGLPELITLNLQANNLSIYRNTGGAGRLRLESPVNYPAGKSPFAAAVGDLDGDGKPDIVVGNYAENRLIIYTNKSIPGNIVLENRLELETGENPSNIAIADFDLDGKPDIACVNMNGHSVSIFRNSGNANGLAFEAMQNFPVGRWPQRFAVGDFDGDKRPDIAVANHDSNNLSILLNNSTTNKISFATKVDLATNTAPWSIEAADLDGDEKKDLIVTYSNVSSIGIYKNNSAAGILAFATKWDIPVGESPLYASVNDLDGNGKPDIALANFGGQNVTVLENTSIRDSIAFGSKTNYRVNGLPRVLTPGDFNGDGQPDLAVVNCIDNNFSVLVNQMRNVPIIQDFSPKAGSTDSLITITGTGFTNVTGIKFGSTAAKSFTATSTQIKAIVGAGTTGDIAVQTTGGGGVAPGFTFNIPAPVISSFQPISGAAGITVILNGKNFSAENSALPVVRFGAVNARVTAASDTTLTVVVPAGATYMPPTVTVNQLTAYAAQPFTITFPSAGGPFTRHSFAPKQDIITEGAPRSTVVQDFNDDGKPDLAVTGQGSATLTIVQSTSSPRNISFGPQQKLAMQHYPFEVLPGDFDGDGKADLALSNPNNGTGGFVTIKRNNSTTAAISFEADITLPAGDGAHRIAIGDLDADGKPDLVAFAGNSAYISIFRNTSAGAGKITFAAPFHIRSLNHSDQGVIADVDGDGKSEIVTADFGNNSLSIWKNNTGAGGPFSFQNAMQYPVGQNPVHLSTGDFNGDGKTDIAVANYASNDITVYSNNSIPGSIALVSKTNLPVGKNPRFISTGDLNGDGRPDLLVSCNEPTMATVFRNLSTGAVAFTSPVAYPTGPEAVHVAAADLDGNGKPEIIVLNSFSTASILRNRMDEPVIESFTPKTATMDSSVTIKGGHFATVSQVRFGGVEAASFRVVSDSVIVATIRDGASGAVRVTNPYGTDSMGGFIYVPPVPNIRSFQPASGTVGTAVQIRGKHFGSVRTVSFGGAAAASFTNTGDTLITAIVNKGATGNIIVSGQDGSDTTGPFTFIPPLPAISSFRPSVATKGTTVTIKGRNLTWTQTVHFGITNAASFTVVSDSVVTALVADGSTGIVKVETEFGRDTATGFIFLEKDAVLAYPNPATGSTALAHPSVDNSSQMSIFDNNGSIIRKVIIPEKTSLTKIDLSQLKPGIYRVVWSDAKNKLQYTIQVR